jgi:hypothetical protein
MIVVSGEIDMGPTDRGLQLIPDFIPDGVLHDQYTPRINAHSRFVECNSERLMQALDVFLDRGSWDSARQDRASARVHPVEPVELTAVDTQLNLTRTLGETGMIREEIKNNALRQRKAQLVLATAIYKKYCDYFLAWQTVAPRHPKAMHDAKMRPCRAEMDNLRDEQVHLVEDGRHTILRRHSVPPSVRSGAESQPQMAVARRRGREAPQGTRLADPLVAGREGLQARFANGQSC